MTGDDVIRQLEEELQTLFRASRAATRDLAREVHPRLDRTTYPMLTLLTNGARRSSDIAQMLALDKSTVTRQIDAAARLGLVRRVPDPSDARARLVVLEPIAEETIARQRSERRERLRVALDTWDAAELADFVRLLRKLHSTDLR
ncbi:MarR family winged helix-turn-helix transcriptional regulator [Stackebrandtia soli]|uniref:MarR family winged helix-turn-helix transcriptional regulator n=1 Tax=Stackebrandtia soli TaxID=1892856 RepID=UPI0039E8F434